jgi:phosphate:Na+ symporter
MAFQGIFGLDTALPLLLGANIGTTITAQLAAIGGTKNARTVAMANTLFKIFGTIIFVPLLVTGLYKAGVLAIVSDRIVGATGTNSVIMVQIAVAHTAFIIVNVILFSTALWPLLMASAKRLSFVGRQTGEEEKTRYLDPLLLKTPPIALEQCVKEVAYMTRQCHKNIIASFAAFIDKNLRDGQKIEKREDEIDNLQADITGYLVQLSRLELSIEESQFIPHLIHCINDAERVGDHAENLMELTELTVNNKLSLSIEAKRDLHNYFDLVDRQFKAVIKALETKDRESVAEALTIETQINEDYNLMSRNHVERLENGTCTVQTGVVFLDVIANLEKIGDHLTNIAERADLNCSD